MPNEKKTIEIKGEVMSADTYLFKQSIQTISKSERWGWMQMQMKLIISNERKLDKDGKPSLDPSRYNKPTNILLHKYSPLVSAKNEMMKE